MAPTFWAGEGGAEDDAHQAGRERDLHQQRLPVLIAGAGQSGAEVLDVPEHRQEEEAGQGGPDELDDDVAGHAPPGEVPPHCECKRHGWVQMGSGDRTHEEDDRHDHEPGGDHGGGQADLPLPDQDPAAGGDQHQEERAEQLREEAAPFTLRVVPFLPRAELERQPVSDPQLLHGSRISALRGKGTSLLRHADHPISCAVSRCKHRRILGETISGRPVQASESPALRGFHGPGRTRTCVLRIMSYAPGVRPYSPEGLFRAWRRPEFC